MRKTAPTTAPAAPVALALATALVAAVWAAKPAAAQSEFSGYHPSSKYTTPSFAPTPPNAIIHHSSTVHEGVGRSVASIIKAYSDGLVNAAQARILIAEARAREYQLRVINTETYLARKQMLQDARHAERIRKYETAQLAKARRVQREQTELYATYRLAPSVLNPATGEIAWPETLEQQAFVDLKTDLQTLFVQLADEGAQYDRLYRDPIAALVNDFRDTLERNRKTLGIEWEDYLASQKMLVGLKYEAEQWATNEAENARRLVASR